MKPTRKPKRQSKPDVINAPVKPQELPGYFPRKVATDLLGKTLSKRMPLDGELDLQNGHPGFKRLEPQDRALTRAIIGTALRRRGQINGVLAQLLERPIPEKTGRIMDILHIALAQVFFMGVANHAAVSLAVELAGQDQRARPYKGLVNAVLRRAVREAEALLESVKDTSVNAPEWMLERWKVAYGEETAARIAQAHLQEPYVDLTARDSESAQWAETKGVLGGEASLGASLRILPEGPIEKLSGFAEGAWWVQDAAAAVPARLLKDLRGKRVADICAAPGGKTLQLAAAGAEVTAVDISARRLQRLQQNLQRMDLRVKTVVSDAREFAPDELFDAILLDAPCSATGTVRRHPDVAWLKREDDIEKLAELQYELLEKAASWLKPGGTLIYCTCSLELEEGELQIQRFLLEHSQFKREPLLPEELGGVAEAINPQGDFRALPCHNQLQTEKTSGLDGFFAARLRLHS
ncbi:16S rRNA (cytosine(967)-C(5))-methyltransferase RsmB [Polycladidibacter hongkongensis]|uniref:16S rRNA (cytosine(967)-C(5))-methyltransferase RsmB n=1 Tax=Polycladidibacter hongkongensis TaxID=1647556 RepID=UPI000AB9C33F|nr:16S rRNA (cytosine(967)-C(5))-methyltransferase RsmB [Pseudovibrio hongkongensis]